MTPDTAVLAVHLRIVGAIMAALVVVNLAVPSRFHWRDDLSRVSLLNRQIFQAHTFFIIVLLGLLAALFGLYADALLEPTPLSRAILAGLTIFWALRMLMQWFFYSPAIWRGHRFNTVMHGLFSAAWVYVTAICGLALWTVS